jgi:hypothetical protein
VAAVVVGVMTVRLLVAQVALALQVLLLLDTQHKENKINGALCRTR